MTEAAQVRWTTGRGLSIHAARHVRLVADHGELWLHGVRAEPRLLGTVASLTSAHLRTHGELWSLRRWPADPADESLLARMPASGRARVIEAERDRSAGPQRRHACGLAAALGLIALLGPGVSIDGFGWLLVAAHLVCLLAVLTGTVGRWWRKRRLLHGGW